MQKWEYQTVVRSRNRGNMGKVSEWSPQNWDIRNLGEDGWELVSVVPIADNELQCSGMTNHLYYYFKRPKKE